ncbi:hypothetical protein BDR26DRAFT_855537 [Obelidium mucronatum]|nr:hypothetical protein BDR26DRAFT_855537 [Obelidium mucronatum]
MNPLSLLLFLAVLNKSIADGNTDPNWNAPFQIGLGVNCEPNDVVCEKGWICAKPTGPDSDEKPKICQIRYRGIGKPCGPDPNEPNVHGSGCKAGGHCVARVPGVVGKCYPDPVGLGKACGGADEFAASCLEPYSCEKNVCRKLGSAGQECGEDLDEAVCSGSMICRNKKCIVEVIMI